MQFAQANRTKPKLQKSLLCQRTTTQQMDRQTAYREEGRTANKVLPKWRLTYFYETFVQGSTFVLRLNFCAKNPPLRQYPKRYLQV